MYQGRTKLSAVDWIVVLSKKGSNAKKEKRKLLLHGSFKIGPSLPLKSMTNRFFFQQKIKKFSATFLCFPLNIVVVLVTHILVARVGRQHKKNHC